jgi:hypothetical protein
VCVKSVLPLGTSDRQSKNSPSILGYTSVIDLISTRMDPGEFRTSHFHILRSSSQVPLFGLRIDISHCGPLTIHVVVRVHTPRACLFTDMIPAHGPLISLPQRDGRTIFEVQEHGEIGRLTLENSVSFSMTWSLEARFLSPGGCRLTRAVGFKASMWLEFLRALANSLELLFPGKLRMYTARHHDMSERVNTVWADENGRIGIATVQETPGVPLPPCSDYFILDGVPGHGDDTEVNHAV